MKKYVLKLLKKDNTRKMDYIDGGVRERIDSGAPKTIECTKLIDFECVFSTLTLVDCSVERSVFTLKAEVKDVVVGASYKSRNEEFAFSANLSFMKDVQNIVLKYDFARFNGMAYRVSGLPDMYGAIISAKYESGECIYSSNNQDCFIPLDAIKELLGLFKKYST